MWTPPVSVTECFLTPDSPSIPPLIADLVSLLQTTSLLHPADVARQLGLPKHELSIACKVLTGSPLGEFVTRWRLCQAADLLRSTDLTVEKIARLCGYRSRKVMDPAFRACYGFTMAGWRKG